MMGATETYSLAKPSPATTPGSLPRKPVSPPRLMHAKLFGHPGSGNS